MAKVQAFIEVKAILNEIQCKQFQFADNMLFGQVTSRFFWSLLKYFLDKYGSTVFEKLVCTPLSIHVVIID